jgi:hypothetical protein
LRQANHIVIDPTQRQSMKIDEIAGQGDADDLPLCAVDLLRAGKPPAEHQNAAFGWFAGPSQHAVRRQTLRFIDEGTKRGLIGGVHAASSPQLSQVCIDHGFQTFR